MHEPMPPYFVRATLFSEVVENLQSQIDLLDKKTTLVNEKIDILTKLLQGPRPEWEEGDREPHFPKDPHE